MHGQSDQHRLLQQRAQREALDRFGGAPLAALLAAYSDLYRRLKAAERELDEVVDQRAGAGPRGRPAPVRPRRGRGGGPGEPGGRRRWRPRSPGWGSPTPCAPPRRAPASRCPARTAPPTRCRRPRRPARSWTASASTTRRRASWPTGSPRSPTCSPTSPPTSRPTRPAWTPTPPGWRPCPSGGRR